MAKSGKKVSRKKVEKKNIVKGVAHIQATFNNTIITICDPAGNVVSWSTAGAKGFKGSRKSTPFSSLLAAEEATKAAQQIGIQEVDVIVKGPGPGRENAIRAIQAAGVKVRSIADITPVPHNGCRPPKKRRV